jgi:hypothetical protein
MELLHHDHEAASCRSQHAQEAQEFNLFAQLKPTLARDGNQWCVLYGENLQVGIAGFGDSPHQAIMDFNSQWYQSLENQPICESHEI